MDTPHNQFHILAERLQNCRERQRHLEIEYHNVRKGSIYAKKRDLLQGEEAGILARYKKIGSSANIVKVSGSLQVTSQQLSLNSVAEVSQEKVEIFYTGISVEDARLITQELLPGLTIAHVQEIATKKVLPLRF